MKKGSKKTLKSLKEEASLCFEREDYSLSLSLCEKIKKYYPKNYYGYLGIIKSKTNDYKVYINDEELKELKKDFDKALELAKKNDKEKLKQEFNEYVDDCMEVENLRKVKKDIVSKHFMKLLYNDGISFINQNINTANSYNLDGKKIVNTYDLIKGLFLFTCLIFNLIYINYLLILTIPFGIFGLITIYSFFNTNFFGKRKLKSEKDYVNKMVVEANKKISNIKKEIEKIDESITLLNERKNNTLLKIPQAFMEKINEYTNNDEVIIASKISNELLNNNISSFTYLINEMTSLNVDDILLKIKPDVKEEDSDLSRFINNKLIEKKNSQNEVLLMKKVVPYNYVVIGILLVISILSIIVIVKNFYEINFISFIYAIITGVISTLIYNINTGKHSQLIDTFNDNLVSCVFNATLIYDLIYSSITNDLNFTYGFIQMPIIFILIFMGFVAIISLLKYNNLLKKLSEK